MTRRVATQTAARLYPSGNSGPPSVKVVVDRYPKIECQRLAIQKA
jgi:hypothetical protein